METPVKQNKMAAMPMGRLVLSMSLPLMISLLVQSLYNIVDGIFVARLSEDALTATSLAYPVQLFMVAVLYCVIAFRRELKRKVFPLVKQIDE